MRNTALIALITGASRGIGAATARLAAGQGYAVCVNYREDRAAAGALVADIERTGGRAIAVAADVSSEPDVVRLFETVDRELGPIAALVNNAGIVDRQARVDQMDAIRLNRMFATNVTGCFLCAREAVRRMSTRHAERIRRLRRVEGRHRHDDDRAVEGGRRRRDSRQRRASRTD